MEVRVARLGGSGIGVVCIPAYILRLRCSTCSGKCGVVPPPVRQLGGVRSGGLPPSKPCPPSGRGGGGGGADRGRCRSAPLVY